VNVRAQRTHRDPGFASMRFIGLPGLEMIAGGEQMKSALRRLASDADKLPHRELLMRQHIAYQSFADANPGRH
jgi:hypothetical protein